MPHEGHFALWGAVSHQHHYQQQFILLTVQEGVCYSGFLSINVACHNITKDSICLWVWGANRHYLSPLYAGTFRLHVWSSCQPLVPSTSTRSSGNLLWGIGRRGTHPVWITGVLNWIKNLFAELPHFPTSVLHLKTFPFESKHRLSPGTAWGSLSTINITYQ